MISISLCMIVKNEELTLPTCLNSVKDLVDEIVIIDTGSTDNTLNVAKLYTNNIHYFEWINDFSAARNYAFSKASKDFIFWIDADYIITEENRKGFLHLKKTLSSDIDYVTMYYDFLVSAEGNILTSLRLNSLVRNFKGFYWQNIIHEDLIAWGNKKDTEIHITHLKKHYACERNVNFIREKIKSGYFLTQKENLLYGQELFYAKYYDDAIRAFNKFLSDPNDIISDKQYACRMLATCYEFKEDISQSINYYIDCLKYGRPYGVDIYKLAILLQMQKRFEEAIYWYIFLINTEQFSNECGEWIKYLPHQQLCICYFNLGDLTRANKYNELAGIYVPEDSYYLYNKDLFSKLLNKEVT